MFLKFPKLYLLPDYEDKNLRKGDEYVLEPRVQERYYGRPRT